MPVPPGDAKLVRQGFSGCLRDVRFKMTDSPSEEWKSLDWAKAIKKVAVYESWEGCPIQTVDGAHFLGHGRNLLIVNGYDFLLIYSLFSQGQCTLTLLHTTNMYAH